MPDRTEDEEDRLILQFINAERRMRARGYRYQHRVRRRLTFVAFLALAAVLLYVRSR